MHFLLHLAAGGTDIATLANGAAGLIGRAISGLFMVLIASKGLHHMSDDRHGAMIVMLLMAVIPGIFLLDPNGALNVIKNTVHAVGG